jgi:peptidoglycan-N-acetylglucosamine deacetylase
VLLAAGGLTLLAGCTSQSEKITATARDRSRRTGRLNPGVSGSQPTLPASPSPSPGHGDARPPAYPGEFTAPMTHLETAAAKSIALTLDDGPSPYYTKKILALLARYGITVTFSMVGVEVVANAAVARDVAAAGHVIANHTWRHLDLAWLPPAAVGTEINRATDVIHDTTGVEPYLFRAPYGAWSAAVLRYCAKAGLAPLDWSVDPRDWSRPGTWSIIDNIMRNTRTGSIILEHDGGGDRSQTYAALQYVIPRLLDSGYHFVTP